MADRETIETSKALAVTTAKTRTVATGVPIRIRNTESATSGTVTVTSNTLTLTDDATTSYAIDFESTYTSVGLVTDYVNGRNGWECVPEDSYRGQTLGASYLLLQGATAATGSQGLAITSTTTMGQIVTSLQHTAFLANDKLDSDIVFANELQYLDFKATNSSGTNTLTLYAVSPTADTTLYTETLTATSTLQNTNIEDLLRENGFKAGYGKRLVVAVAQQTAGGTLNVIGETYRASPVNV